MTAAPDPKVEPPKDYLLAALRCGSLRAQLLAFEMKECGVLLSLNAITPKEAVDWVHSIEAIDFVAPAVEAGAAR